jgi:hypothetical protein
MVSIADRIGISRLYSSPEFLVKPVCRILEFQEENSESIQLLCEDYVA